MRQGLIRRSPLALIVLSAPVTALVALPVVWVVVSGLGAGDVWSALLSSGRLKKILLTSLMLTAIVGTASAAIGVFLSWLAERTDIPGGRWLSAASAAPLGVPSFLFAVVLLSLAGPGGVYQSLTGETASFIYGIPGSALVLTVACVPFTVILTRNSFLKMDRSLEEAAQSLGAGRLRTLSTITFPLILPAAAAGALLSGLYTLADFGTPALMRTDTFSAAIYTQITTRYSRAGASALSLVLVVLTALMLIGHYQILRQARIRGGATVVGAPRDQLGFLRWPLALVAWSYVAIVTGIPLLILAIWAFRSGLAGEFGRVLEGVLKTLAVAVPAATISILAAMPIARLSLRYRGILPTIVTRITQFGDTIPGIVTALALGAVSLRFLPPLYGSLVILIIACTVMFFTRAVQGVTASLLPISRDLEDAADSVTPSRFKVWTRILLPLAQPGLSTAWLMIFLSSIKELPATLLLRPPGFNTLATEIWIQSSEGYYSRAAVPALALLALSFLATLLLQRGGEQFETVAK